VVIVEPSIIINFKTYDEGSGNRGLELARICEKISDSKNVEIVVAPQVADIFRISSRVDIPVISQTIDAYDEGKHTGSILAEDIKDAGAVGTLVNHSECQKSLEEIEKILEVCRRIKLTTVCCASTPEMAQEIARLSPDIIAIEPPELIGTGISVSKAKPGVITKTLKKVHDIDPNIPVLCGAGISNNKDLMKALKLGAVGVLVSSDIVTAENPEAELEELLKTF
jgi:triosephosphate isomerase